MTWHDLRVLVRQAPPGSAVDRAVNPEDYAWGLPEQLLAGILDVLAVANWQRGSAKRSDFPKPVERPGVRPDRAKFGSGALPMHEMAQWLGWTQETEVAHG